LLPVTTDPLRKEFGKETVTHFTVYKMPDDQNEENMLRSNISININYGKLKSFN
jgi:hypothetical protein